MRRSLTLTMLVIFSGLNAWCGEPTPDDNAGRSELVEKNAALLTRTDVSACLQQELGFERNLVWCATFQLAWNELMDLGGGRLQVEGFPPMASFLNQKLGTKQDLDPASYVAKAGYAPAIIPEINKALENTFKGAAVPRLLPENAGAQGIVAYAYLARNVSFAQAFATPTGRALDFRNAAVSSFGVWPDAPNQKELLKQVAVLDYKSDTDFIVELLTQQKDEHLIVARLKPMKTLEETVEEVSKRIKRGRRSELLDDERLQIPALNFDLTRRYDELIGKGVVSAAIAKGTVITEALQNIRFRLDEKGAVLKSDAVIKYKSDADPADNKRKPRMLICDGPFLIMLRHKDRNFPYFALWIDNAEVLVRKAFKSPENTAPIETGAYDDSPKKKPAAPPEPVKRVKKQVDGNDFN